MKIIRFLKENCPPFVPWALLSLLIFAILALIAPYATPLADFVNSWISTPLRVLLANFTYLLPISIFEVILYLVPVGLIALIIYLVLDKRGWGSRIRTLAALIGVVAIIFSGYLCVMAIPYHTTPLNEHLGISDIDEVETYELFETTLYVQGEVNALADKLVRDEEGISHSGYTLEKISSLVSRSYEGVREKYPFFYNFESRAKPVMSSYTMSDMGITGIYTYFTGEANINMSYPDYSTVFVVAHELAHQRGINRENEANFMAFLVCISSDDDFLRYSGYLYLYEYLASALNRTDWQLYAGIADNLSPLALNDIRASNEITKLHRSSPLYKFMQSLNNAYLKANGTDGVISYGYIVRLAVAYYRPQIME